MMHFFIRKVCIVNMQHALMPDNIAYCVSIAYDDDDVQ